MRISLRELMLVVAVAAVGLAGLKYATTGMLPVVQAVTGLVLIGAIVRAAVDRGAGQAFAIGFIVFSLGYIIAAQTCDGYDTMPTSETMDSSFQPTRWWLALGRPKSGEMWLDITTGRPLTFDPTLPIEDEDEAAQPFRAMRYLSLVRQQYGRNSMARPIQFTYLEGANLILNPPRDIYVAGWEDLLRRRVFTSDQLSNVMKHSAANLSIYGYASALWPRDFVCVGHCLATLLLGLVGGHIAQVICTLRHRNLIISESSRAASSNSLVSRWLIGQTLVNVLFVVVGLVLLRFASWTPVAALVQVATGFIVLTYCLVAVIAQGRRKACAIGFAASAAAFGVVLLWGTPYFVDSLGMDRLSGLLYARLASDRWTDTATGQILDQYPTSINTTATVGTADSAPAGALPPPAAPSDPQQSIESPPPMGRGGRGFPPNLGGAARGRGGGSRGSTDSELRAAETKLQQQQLDLAIQFAEKYGRYKTIVYSPFPNVSDFKAAFVCLSLLAFGWFGGLLANAIYARQPRD